MNIFRSNGKGVYLIKSLLFLLPEKMKRHILKGLRLRSTLLDMAENSERE